MSRDHKPVNRRVPEARKSRGGTLLGIFIGLIFGVGAALAVVWYMNKTPAPFVQNKTGIPLDGGKAAAPATPAPLPGKPGDPPVEKRFQFYDILPGKSEPRPDGKPAEAPGGNEKPAAPASAGVPEAAKAPVTAHSAAADTQLQAGSFQNSKDADNLRANLALSGLEAVVQQVMVGEKVWYRVRLGPYGKPEEMTRVRTELSKMGIEATVVKSKD